MDDLGKLRRSGLLALTAVAWLLTLVIAAAALAMGTGWTALLLAVLMTAGPTALAIAGRSDAATRLVFGVTMPAYPALLLLQFAGAPWQIDLHMLFFATIACLAALADWRPIVVGATVTAVHHLAGTLLLPSIVFPAGTDLVARVLLHAAILIMETAVLVWIASRLEALILGQAASRAEREAVEAAAARQRELAAQELGKVVASISGGLEALSRGDLRQSLDDAYPASYEPLRLNYNQARARLADMVGGVSDSAGGIERGASEIRAASNDLALRTEQQAASLEETAAAMNQVTDTVQETSRAVAEVNASLRDARAVAHEGEEIVGRAVEAMQGLQVSTNEITQIVDVIDGIAFQTNLLALNAGVEAARAGESGKGFAVVATEVRSLAQRSAEAASRIKALIDRNLHQVGGGVSLVGETGGALKRIVDSISQIGSLAETIAVSAESQARQILQVRNAVGEMDRMTQQNAAMVEQTSASSRNFASEAVGLANLVSKFQTQGATPAKGAAPAPAPAPMRVVAAPSRPAPSTVGNLALVAETEDWSEF